MNQTPNELKFEEVARSLSESLLRYLKRLVGDTATAEDLLQEVLVKVAHGLPGFEGRSSLKTWVFTIATRVVSDHFRRPGAKLKIVEVDEAESLPDLSIQLDERIVVDEMSDCVRGVIDNLPEDYRAALVLHDLEGLTAAETAEICGCSLATAKIRIHRSRMRLKKALQSECTFYRDREDVFRCDRKTDAENLASGDTGSDS